MPVGSALSRTDSADASAPTDAEPASGTGLDADACWAAMRSRDPRFDGIFVSAVVSTHIYCRPSCPALAPVRTRVRFLPTPAAAQAAGFRACKRCRPDSAPGSPDWDVRGDVTSRVMRLVEDGVVDREGVQGLATRVGYSPRQLRRHLTAQLGAGPLRLARSHRAQTARVLLENTDMPVVDVAFAAGFGSLRQCNDTLREVYASTPTALRGRRPEAQDRGPGEQAPYAAATTGAIVVRLPHRLPAGTHATLAFLGAHAIEGVESWDGESFARTLDLPHGPGSVRLSAGPDHVVAELLLCDVRDLTPAVARCRRLLDLDADPAAVDEHLRADPVLAPLVAAHPGRRSAGTVDGPETALRTLLGQQVSLAAARLLGRRLTLACGSPAVVGPHGLTHLFPRAEAVAALDPETLPMPRARARALVGLAAALAGGLRLDPGADRDQAEHELLALSGVGPWTARYVRMRALADPDVLLVEDLAVRRVATGLGLPTDAEELRRRGTAWRPWRSYATGLLWAPALEAIGRPA